MWFGLHILPTLKSENCIFQLFEYISISYYNLCVSSIKKCTINEKVFAKHRKIKEDINNKRFPVRDISVNFRFGFGFGIHFLPATSYDFREGRSRNIFYLVSCYRLFKWLCVMFFSAEDDEKDLMSGGKGFVYFTVL